MMAWLHICVKGLVLIGSGKKDRKEVKAPHTSVEKSQIINVLTIDTPSNDEYFGANCGSSGTVAGFGGYSCGEWLVPCSHSTF